MRSAKEQVQSDRWLAAICGAWLVAWAVVAVIIFVLIAPEQLRGPEYILLPLIAGLGSVLVMFVCGLIILGMLLLLAAVKK